MAIRISWDKYEAAILLDACIKVDNNEKTRCEAITMVSKELRNRANTRGIVIDDIYRNENGIGMQMNMSRCTERHNRPQRGISVFLVG